MKVRVLYFAALRERRGRAEEVVEVPEGATAGDVFDRVLPGEARAVAFTRNRVVVPGDAPLADGDELAFLPPLGGG